MLDPRGEDGGLAVAHTRDAPAAAAWWTAKLSEWRALGIAGFRLLGLSHLAPSFVASVCAGTSGAALIGWTPGTSAEWRAAFAETGEKFDLVASSLPWWDFSAAWFADEAASLRALGPVIAPVEAPFGMRLAAQVHEPGALRAAYRRALWVAASQPAWLMPMGFEFAATDAMDPRDTPAEWAAALAAAPFDLSSEIAAVNAARASESRSASATIERPIGAPGAPYVIDARLDAPDPRFAKRAVVRLVNASLLHATDVPASAMFPELAGRFSSMRLIGSTFETMATRFAPGDVVTLPAGAVALFAGKAAPPVAASAATVTVKQAAASPRYAIESVTPSVDAGQFPVKRIAGEVVVVECDVVADGHEELGVALRWRPDSERGEWRETRMRSLGNDRWQASFPLDEIGRYSFAIEAWRDAYGTYHHELHAKHRAGIETTLEVEEGRRLVAAIAEQTGNAGVAALKRMIDAADIDARRTLLLSGEAVALMAKADQRHFSVRSDDYPVQAERTGAGYASWYEIFPRSMSDDETRHGTFRDVIRHLPRIAGMGFDVLYFPPFHPIGRAHRKGRNNTLTPAPDDPGSPYAIGSHEGGHDALHPELGTFEDFEALRVAAEAHGLELAIDFAVQCSPDHPWLREHPDWFVHRPDGTIKYAENPPKKYQDIVNVDFYADGSVPSLWTTLRDIVLFWAERGIRLFRVDNPHTKPFPFWQWMIADVQRSFPEAIFLAEAFTKPKVMYRLAKVGFSQSYTYFTWRNEARELREYLTELTATAPREFFRPHLFVNTPDINPVFLQTGGRPAHLIRAALAATLSGLWGVYSGFELTEATPLPGREEYLDSEKYQMRAWDWDRPGNIVAEITQLNKIRRQNPALHTHLGITFLDCDDAEVLWFEKATADRANVVTVAISTNPRAGREPLVDSPRWRWSPEPDAIRMDNLLDGGAEEWQGPKHRLRLTPERPYAIWRATLIG